MATIVQPYNDWRERAAVNILGPIITGLINRHWQNEDNRKINALVAQTLSDAQPSTGLLNAPEAPSGYNADPWASAFHQTNSPLTQYDIATTGLVPVQSLQKAPTMADYLGALVSNGGTRRFGNVNMQAAVAAMTPLLQAGEQDRQEQRRSEVADAYAQAKDAGARRDVITGGLLRGILPESIGASAMQFTPFPQSITYNDGEQMHFLNRDQQTGNITDIMQIANQISPQQKAENSYRDRVLRSQTEQNTSNRKENARQFNLGHNLRERQQSLAEDNSQYERNNPKLESIIGSDGTAYLVNTRTGNVTEIKTPQGKNIKINPKSSDVILKEDGNGHYIAVDRNTNTAVTVTDTNGKPVTAPQRSTANSNRDMTTSQQKEYDNLSKEAQELRKERSKYQEQADVFADDTGDTMYKSAAASLERIDNRLNEIEQRQRRILGDTSAQTNRKNNESSDIQPSRTADSEKAENNDAKPVQRKSGDKVTVKLPDEIFYNYERDKDIPEENIYSMQRFKAWLNKLLLDPAFSHMTPEQIVQMIFNNSYRVKRG